jgi:Insertion element 4 transposase N-terminal/Transposase DDE domain
MPRSGWVKPASDRRLSDLVSVGVLTRVFPPDLVDDVIAQAGRTQQRNRSLPARAMAYFAIGMGLYSEGSYEDVLAALTDGLSWASGWQESFTPPSKSAIFQARARLGPEPLAALFAQVAKPIGTSGMPGVWLGSRRLVAIDGSCLDVADTFENAAFFGRLGVPKGEKSAFPQARLVALAECGTHAMFDAVVGAYSSSEIALAEELVGRLEPGMLLLADRGFYSYALWRKAIGTGTGADLLWRAKTGLRPEHLKTLQVDSWLAQIRPGDHPKPEPITVRVIDYTIDDGRENPASYRLFTTILDPAQASAIKLAAAYVQRWEIELAFDELKTHQRGPAPCCAQSPPSSSCRRSGDTCAATTRYGH